MSWEASSAGDSPFVCRRSLLGLHPGIPVRDCPRGQGRGWVGVENLFHFLEIEIVTFQMGAVMDDFGPSFRLEATLPGGDERSVSDDFPGRVYQPHVLENFIGDCVGGRVGHESINALYAVNSKSF